MEQLCSWLGGNYYYSRCNDGLPRLLPEPLIGGVGGEVRGEAPPLVLWRVGAVRLDLGDICNTQQQPGLKLKHHSEFKY